MVQYFSLFFETQYFSVLSIEEPHQFILNLVDKLYCDDNIIEKVLRRNSSIPGVQFMLSTHDQRKMGMVAFDDKFEYSTVRFYKIFE